MSRPSKYNPETSSRFLSLVEEGYPIKIACNKVGITDMTLSRWKKRYPEFVEALRKATDRQWVSIDDLHRVGIRVYRRNPNKMPHQDETFARSGLVTPQSNSCASDIPKLYRGLKVRSGGVSEDEPFTPCVNPENGMVEYLKKQNGANIKHVCTVDAFRRGNPGWYRRLASDNLRLRSNI